VAASLSALVPNALYHVRLVATNGAGTTYGPDGTFMILQDPAPPPPVVGQTVNTAPVAGLVLIKLPTGSGARDVTASAALAKGQGFIPLTEARQIPSGSQVDARHGSLQMITASAKVGKTQQGVFGGAIFGVAQDRSGINKGLTTLSLLEGDFPGAPTYAGCPRAAADSAHGHARADQRARAANAARQG
jgi:hypothetical protein